MKNPVFRKLVSHSFLHTNSNPLVKNSECPPIRDLVHDHIQVSRLIGYFVIIQRVVIFLVKRRGVLTLKKDKISNSSSIGVNDI